MTPEETKLRELEQAQSNVAAQVAEQGNKRAAQESYAAMEAQNQRIQEDIQKRESELQRIGMPTQPYQPAYSSPGMTMGERVGEIGQTAAQSIKTVGSGVVGGLGNMMSGLGSAVRPIFKTEPMPVAIGYGGYHTQRQGLFKGLMSVMGVGSTPQTAMAMEHQGVLASDTGERLGMGAAAATATLGGIAASVYASKIPGAAAAGSALGGAAGGLVGARAAGAAVGRFAMPWLALPMAGYELGSAAVDAVKSRRETEGFLEASSFRFAGSGSDMYDTRMGKGISRDKRRDIAEMVRTADIEDSLMGGQDVKNILKEGARYGMFDGASGDLDQFKKRFTEMKDNVREMAKTMNVTLEEGLATLKELYGAGVDVSKGMEIATVASATGRVAGRTASEMITIGLQGAEQFRGTGVDMEIGMRGTMMNLSAIRAARDAGTISKSAIEQAGGEEALAMRRTQRQVQFSQSEEGRSYMASFFDPSTGGMNMQAFEKAMGGDDLSISDLATQAAANLNDPSKLIKFESNQEQMASEMGKAFGGRGLQFGQWNLAMAEAKMMSDQTGASREDSFRSIMLRKGISPQELEAIQGEAAASQDVFKASQKAGATERDRREMEEGERARPLSHALDKIYDAGKKLIDLVANLLNVAVGKVIEGVEKLGDYNSGIVRGNVTGKTTGTVGGMITAGESSDLSKDQIVGRQELLVKREGLGPMDASGVSSLTSKLLPFLDDSAGAVFLDKIRSGDLGQDLKKEGLTTQEGTKGLALVMETALIGDTVTGVTPEQFKRANRRAEILGMSNDKIKRMEEAGTLKEAFGEGSEEKVRQAILDVAADRVFEDPDAPPDVVMNKILEKIDPKINLDNISARQTGAIYKKLDELNQGKSLNRFREAGTAFSSAVKVGRTVQLGKVAERFETALEDIERVYKFSPSANTIEKLGIASVLRSDQSSYEMMADPEFMQDKMKGSGIFKDILEDPNSKYLWKENEFKAEFGGEMERAVYARVKDMEGGPTFKQLKEIMTEESVKLSNKKGVEFKRTVDSAREEQMKASPDLKMENFNDFLENFLAGEKEIPKNVKRFSMAASLSGLRRVANQTVNGAGIDEKEKAKRIKEASDAQDKIDKIEEALKYSDNAQTSVNKYITASKELTDLQGERAGDSWVGILEEQLVTDKSLTTKDANLVRPLIAKLALDPRAAFNLRDEDKKLLGKTTVGQNLLQRAEDLSVLKEKLEKDPEMKDEATAKAFQFFGKDAEQRIDLYKDSGADAVVSKGFADAVTNTVGEQMASNMSNTGDRGTQTSKEMFEVMTAQNWTILGALQSLHTKIKE